MKNVAAAIDFGTKKIVTLVAESGGFSRCDIIGSGTVEYDGYSQGRWNTPDKLVQAIRNTISAAEVEANNQNKGANIRIKELYVGVPCEHIRVLSSTEEIQVGSADGRVSEEDTNAIQDAAAEKLGLMSQGCVVIHRSPAWFTVDGGKKTMSPVGLSGQVLKAHVSFVLADPEFIEDIRMLFDGLGITIMGFLSSSMGEALLLLPIDERDRAAVLIDVGYLNTEFSVIEGDAIVYHCVLPLGGGHIAADLALELEIPMAAAERIKHNFIFSPDDLDPVQNPEIIDGTGRKLTFEHETVARIIENDTAEIAEMVALAIEDAKAHLGPRSQVFMTGGGLAMMRGGREYLSAKLNRPVKTPTAKAAKLNSPKYASALGLVDLVFDSIEQRAPQDGGLTGRLAGGIRGLFKKK